MNYTLMDFSMVLLRATKVLWHHSPYSNDQRCVLSPNRSFRVLNSYHESSIRLITGRENSIHLWTRPLKILYLNTYTFPSSSTVYCASNHIAFKVYYRLEMPQTVRSHISYFKFSSSIVTDELYSHCSPLSSV